MWHDSEIARRVDGGIEVRSSSLRVRWDLTDLTTSDGHTVNAVFACAVRPLTEPIEQKMLDEVFLSTKSVATTQDVTGHFMASLQAAAEKFTSESKIDSLVSGQGPAALQNRLMQAAGAVAFACGLEILPPWQLDLDSPTLRNSRRDQLAREQARQSAIEQAERMAHSADLFKQFQAMRQSAPELSTAQVLARVGLSDQSEIIRSLLMASAAQSAAKQLWAVAGPYLIGVEWLADAPKAVLIPLPPTLGPLRSVQEGLDGTLLIGARGGVMSVNPAQPDSPAFYTDPDASSAMGFNQVLRLGKEIWATHADAGLVCWNIDDGKAPAKSLRPSDASFAQFSPHQLAIIDGRILIGTGNRLLQVTGEMDLQEIQTSQREEILTILPHGKGALIIYCNGQLCSIDFNSSAGPCIQRRAGRITAAAPMPWVQDTRLLLATQDGPIVCAGFDDELLTNYSSIHQGLKIVAANASRIAAVTSDRQRVIYWNAWDGRKPAGELHLAGLAKHRIADIAFI